MIALLEKVQRWEWIPLAVILLWVVYWAVDLFVPVVWMDGSLVSKTETSVIVAIHGWKVRECRYHGIQAYSVDGEGRRRAANIKRIDSPAHGRTHPRGHYDLGQWEIQPLMGGVGVIVYAHHSCDGEDLRMTKMAEVRL